MPLLERLLLRGHIDRIKPADQDISIALDGHWTAENVVLFTSGKNCRAHNPNVMPPGWSLSHRPESRACNPCWWIG